MICSNDPELLKDVRAMRWVGIDKDNWKVAQSYTKADRDAMHWYYELRVLGYKYNMNDLAASIGLVQLDKLDKMNKKRSEIIDLYLKKIAPIEGLVPLVPYSTEKYVYQMFGIRVANKKNTILHLKSKGIATGCHYTPLSVQPLFEKWGNNCPYIEQEINRCITLPLHTKLTKENVEYIVQALSECSI
jgi:perosamine synthetase